MHTVGGHFHFDRRGVPVREADVAAEHHAAPVRKRIFTIRTFGYLYLSSIKN